MYNDEFAIAEINQITDTLTNTKVGNRPKTPDMDLQSKTTKDHTYWGNCWKCGKFGHSGKECQNNITTANHGQIHNIPTNLQTIQLIRYPTPTSPARPPILAQQIMADFQLSQEAWTRWSSQMNEITETNKCLKKAVKCIYKKVKNVLKQDPKKTHNNMKASKKMQKTVKFIENPTKDKRQKDTNKTLKGKNVKNISKKNITPNMNTVSEIQVSDSDKSIDTEDNENDSMDWRSLPDMATTSEDSDSSDNDGTEWLDDSFYEQNHTIIKFRICKVKIITFWSQTSHYQTNNSSTGYWSYMLMHISTSIHENFRQS